MPDLQQVWWSQLEPGQHIQAPDATMWEVAEVAAGWVRLTRSSMGTENHHVTHEERRVPPQPQATTATLVVPTLLEAEMMVAERLGGTVVHRGRVEALARWLARAPKMKVPAPSPRSPGAVRMHLALMHAKHTAGMEPKEMRALHAELHDVVDGYGWPHIHG